MTTKELIELLLKIDPKRERSIYTRSVDEIMAGTCAEIDEVAVVAHPEWDEPALIIEVREP